MMKATLEEAQAELPALIAKLRPGEELVILEKDRPVARLVAEPAPPRKARQPGSAIGTLRIVEEDDEHLKDFTEYVP
jgi:antitoxin (DNA-binding transcriptional repressor) of toxin-antitoxin stability system